MAIVQNLVIDQGSTFSIELTVYGDDRYPLNLTPYTPTAQIRKSPTSTSYTNFTCNKVDPGTSGKINIALTDEQTAALRQGRYMYDVVIEASGERFRVIEGIVTVMPSITKPVTP